MQLVEGGHGRRRPLSGEERPAHALLGAEPVVLDLLDPDAVREAVAAARPDAILLSDGTRGADRPEALRPQLRADGAGGPRAPRRWCGCQRGQCRSLRGPELRGLALRARDNGPVKSEDDPLDPSPVPDVRESLAAIRRLERMTVDAEQALRYGGLYGSPDDAQLALVRARRFPIIEDGDGMFSFVHLNRRRDRARIERAQGVAQRGRRRAGTDARVAADPRRDDRPRSAAQGSPLARTPGCGRGRRDAADGARGASNCKAKRGSAGHCAIRAGDGLRTTARRRDRSGHVPGTVPGTSMAIR